MSDIPWNSRGFIGMFRDGSCVMPSPDPKQFNKSESDALLDRLDAALEQNAIELAIPKKKGAYFVAITKGENGEHEVRVCSMPGDSSNFTMDDAGKMAITIGKLLDKRI